MSVVNPSLFIYHKDSVVLYVLVHVNNILLIVSSSSALDDLVATLGRAFSLKDLGPAQYFLGMEITPKSHGIVFTQRWYILDLLQRTNLVEAKPLTSPMVVTTKLSKFSGDHLFDPSEYQRIIGSLQNVTIMRLDISFSVNKVCQFLHSPTIEHWTTIKRILRYLKHTANNGFHFYSTSALLTLRAFSDFDWVGYPDDRGSTRGYLIYRGAI
ncbi:PREDICTED: uncharacterized protein LOC109115717 [Nelumbo nucifera]|uniref:Uncharacterized protein LOC109115717 n=1 Tax=Nelumbo nucifera TaxID=4432 RepID=A0A1U8QBR5_NELNU|nr:PREDICTED: uncharacterized protein LOC109115717 [Nelumbo nucifera]